MASPSESKAGEAAVVATLDAVVLAVSSIATKAVEGQKPGTSGLRKKTRVFQEGYYLHNFVQACFDALPEASVKGTTWVVSGDGRYFCKEATQTIIKIAFANGVSRVLVGINAIMSTPAVSAVIRGVAAAGGLLLTASHNPGGPDDDFGVKLNVSNGGPAPEGITSAIFERTKTIDKFVMCEAMPDVDLATVGITQVGDRQVEVFDATINYVDLMKKVFDFEAIRKLIARDDFSILYDGMSGVVGPFAKSVLVDQLGAKPDSLVNCVPLEDFGGGHPDPNLVYAKELVEKMGLTTKGLPVEEAKDAPDFGGAADGDADRNMILGARWFVTPSDSLAIIADYADSVIPFFKGAGGLKAVSRSMPTSGAIDRVAASKGLKLFEVPTGWKFFGNLMDSKELYGKEDYTPFLCGEESFGTGSNHIREKDGLWAILAWLSIIASRNVDVPVGSDLVTVRQINVEHWMKYGRNYYSRYDYEGVTSEAGAALMDHLRAKVAAVADAKAAGGGSYAEEVGKFTLSNADEFEYVDPVDGSVSSRQGIRLYFSDGSRVVFRLSGTGSVGATIRMYLEYYESEKTEEKLVRPVAEALAPLVEAALALSNLKEISGRDAPTVIT